MNANGTQNTRGVVNAAGKAGAAPQRNRGADNTGSLIRKHSDKISAT